MRGDDVAAKTAERSAPAARRGPWRLPAGGVPAGIGDAAWLWLGATFERELEAGRGFLWLPVCFGIGILVYFALPQEPSLIALVGASAVLIAVTIRARPHIGLFRLLVMLTAAFVGATTMKIRTDVVAAPVVTREMTATVRGWIAEVEASARGGLRVVLSVSDIEGLAEKATPSFVRITIRSGSDGLSVGRAVAVRARLAPASGPVMPGGFDFGHALFYERIGGVGFAYGAAKPAELGAAPLAVRLAEPVAELRAAIRHRIVAALPGNRGEIAAALTMGDQGGISEATQDAMRASGLGHVLSISGLHMVLVAGSAFWLIRALLALSTRLALLHPIKKWAAAGALAVGAFYLAISGGGVATERAFIMLAIMLVAVLLDRRAITLRNVAFAALVILVLEPESLGSASFQMSFAATIALVAGYEAIAARADRRLALADTRRHPWVERASAWASGLFLTSLIAGVATTPFAIYHFQRAAPLALLANLAAMPVVGIVVMPMALFAVVLMPFGLEAAPLAAMGSGIDWMLAVADATARWSEGMGAVRMAPALSLLLVAAGFLWLTLWGERWRFAGIVPILLAVPVALAAPRPDILIDASGEALAARGPDGRFRIIGARGHTFEAETWLRADADTGSVAERSEGVRCDPLGCTAPLGGDGTDLVALGHSRAAFGDDCLLAAVVVSRFAAPAGCALTATVIDRRVLAEGGAQALYRLPSDIGETLPRFRAEAAYPAIRRPFMPPMTGWPAQ